MARWSEARAHKQDPAVSADEWRPDWKDLNNYPNPETTSFNQWAWEFLRRNSEYEISYKRFVADIPIVEAGKNSIFWKDVPKSLHQEYSQVRSKFYLNLCLIDPSCNYDAHSFTQILQFALPGGNDTDSPDQCLGMQTRDYFETDAENYEEKVTDKGWECTFRNFKPLHAWQPYETVIRFDLRLPIAAQIQQAKRILLAMKEIQSEKFDFPSFDSKQQRDKFPEYLRLLDARHAGVTKREMCESVLNCEYDPDSKAIKTNLVAAERLQNEDYILLAVANMRPI